MAFSYTSLVADKATSDSIKSWVNDNTIPSTTILLMAEQFLYRNAKLRIRDMLGTETGTMTISQDYEVLSGLTGTYLGPILSMHYTGVEKDLHGIRRSTVERVEERFTYDADGNRENAKPQFFYVDATNIQFNAPADKAYGWRARLFLEPAALSGSNETNFLTDSRPWLLLSACMWAASYWRKNEKERIAWEQKAREAVFEANAEFDQERFWGIADIPVVE